LTSVRKKKVNKDGLRKKVLDVESRERGRSLFRRNCGCVRVFATDA